MFGLISKRRIIKEAVRAYLNNDTKEPCPKENFYYNCGNANALNALCRKLGIDLTAEVKKVKMESEEK